MADTPAPTTPETPETTTIEASVEAVAAVNESPTTGLSGEAGIAVAVSESDDTESVSTPGSVSPATQPGSSSPQPGPTVPGVSKMALDASALGISNAVQLAFEQGFQRNHQVGMNNLNREEQAMGNIAEQTRLSYLEAKAAGFDLASSILEERSASQQPQVGIVAAAPPVSVFKPATS